MIFSNLPTMNRILLFIICLGLPLLVGFGGSYFTDTGEGTWYTSIQKPSWNPPGWVFGPVWTTLYILMGISLFLVWKQPGNSAMKRTAIVVFFIQLALNFAWSFIFFDQHEIGWATVEIAVLWIAILVTIILFSKISRLAACLLVPYLLWVSFASALTYTIYSMNE